MRPSAAGEGGTSLSTWAGNKDALDEEAFQRLCARIDASGGDAARSRIAVTRGPSLDFNAEWAGVQRAAAVAGTVINSPQTLNFDLVASGAEVLRVWLNGRELPLQDGSAALITPDRHRLDNPRIGRDIIPVRLRQGRNFLVVSATKTATWASWRAELRLLTRSDSSRLAFQDFQRAPHLIDHRPGSRAQPVTTLVTNLLRIAPRETVAEIRDIRGRTSRAILKATDSHIAIPEPLGPTVEVVINTPAGSRRERVVVGAAETLKRGVEALTLNATAPKSLRSHAGALIIRWEHVAKTFRDDVLRSELAFLASEADALLTCARGVACAWPPPSGTHFGQYSSSVDGATQTYLSHRPPGGSSPIPVVFVVPPRARLSRSFLESDRSSYDSRHDGS